MSAPPAISNDVTHLSTLLASCGVAPDRVQRTLDALLMLLPSAAAPTTDPPDDWVARTRALLAEPGGCPDLEATALRLELSARTLRRYLQLRGTTFHRLRDEARRTRALALVTGSRLTLGAIAAELGYATAPAFVRAFARWTGESPSRYRERTRTP